MWDKQKDLEYFKTLWNSRKSTGMSHKKADWDVRAGDWAYELEHDEVRKQRSADRVAATCDYLRSKGLLGAEDDVIDIGCGPGRFVSAFAETAHSALGIDISSEMCRYGAEHAAENGVSNASFKVCDFKQTDIDEAGWRNRFDLVFSSITPAMSTLDSLYKSMEMSRAYCFQSNFVKAEDEVVDMVLKEVAPDVTRLARYIRATYALVNVLWMEGFFPEVTYYREYSRSKKPVTEKMAHQILSQAPRADQSDAGIRKVMDLLLQHADEDGMIERSSVWTYSWVLWDIRVRQ